jgi:2-oxopent-4-enoate/cis-2-oxohex-4-enoate hydratase
MGVDQPDFGCLLSDMVYGDGDAIPMASVIAPKVEGEIAFVLTRTLSGRGVTNADALRATEYVMPCFEIVDSGIRDWKSRKVSRSRHAARRPFAIASPDPA